MAEILNCEKRETTGTLRMRRLRQSGLIPAVLYGKGDNLSLQIPSKDLGSAIRHGSRVVELKGCCNESAMIKDVQWDAFGVDILHVDLTRIDAGEAVDLTLTVELVGEAPGTKTGGMIKHMLHSIEVKIPANAVPEKLELKINGLELNDSLKASDIALPEGSTLLTPADEVVVQCVEASGQEEEKEADPDAPAEPEVIGRKAEDESEGED